VADSTEGVRRRGVPEGMYSGCEHCAYGDDDGKVVKWCRRYPPRAAQYGGATTWEFALVKPGDWCGEFVLDPCE
jgi:hypothetical protein